MSSPALRPPAKRVFLSQLQLTSASPDATCWVQGVIVWIGDHIDDGTAVVALHCQHIVENHSLQWESVQLYNYVLAGLNAVRVVDLSENPNRETAWILETIAQQVGYDQQLSMSALAAARALR